MSVGLKYRDYIILKESERRTPKVNTQMKLSVSLDWLENNPMENEEDVKFVLNRVELFLNTNIRMENEKNNTARDQLTCMCPFIRLVHCLSDCEKNNGNIPKFVHDSETR